MGGWDATHVAPLYAHGRSQQHHCLREVRRRYDLCPQPFSLYYPGPPCKKGVSYHRWRGYHLSGKTGCRCRAQVRRRYDLVTGTGDLLVVPGVADEDGTPVHGYFAGMAVRVTSRSIQPRWGPIRFRPLARTFAPLMGRTCRRASETKKNTHF